MRILVFSKSFIFILYIYNKVFVYNTYNILLTIYFQQFRQKLVVIEDKYYLLIENTGNMKDVYAMNHIFLILRCRVRMTKCYLRLRFPRVYTYSL